MLCRAGSEPALRFVLDEVLGIKHFIMASTIVLHD